MNLQEHINKALDTGSSKEEAQEIGAANMKDQLLQENLRKAKSKMELNRIINEQLSDRSQKEKDKVYLNISKELNLVTIRENA